MKLLRSTFCVSVWFALASCEKSTSPPTPHQAFTLQHAGDRLIVYTVTLDGNEYYAVHQSYGWTLCPKLPTKPAP